MVPNYVLLLKCTDFVLILGEFLKMALCTSSRPYWPDMAELVIGEDLTDRPCFVEYLRAFKCFLVLSGSYI